MADSSTVIHKFEVAIDLINEVQRQDKKENENHDSGSKVTKGIKNHDEKEAVSSDPSKDSASKMHITPGQVKEIVKKFKLFDRNRDRSLDIDEMASVFRALGQNPTRKELRAIMEEADKDGNGKIDEKEYVDLLMKHMQTEEQVEDDMMEAFNVFDKNSDGKVDTQELGSMLQMCGEPLTQAEAEKLMSLMDENGDGYIDIKEFVRFLCRGERSSMSKVKKNGRKKGK